LRKIKELANEDDDGIELPNHAEALAYAYLMIRELKTNNEGGDLPLHLLVKNWIRKTIFRVAFEEP
jgi:hypothetical protein